MCATRPAQGTRSPVGSSATSPGRGRPTTRPCGARCCTGPSAGRTPWRPSAVTAWNGRPCRGSTAASGCSRRSSPPDAEPRAAPVVQKVRSDRVEGRPAEDTTLVERAQHGDVDAYGELVRRYQGIATRTAYVITGPSADEADAAPDACEKRYYALR